MMWKRKKQMYGRRKASQAFNDYMAKVLEIMGFEQFTALTQFWIQRKREILIDLHQDDIHASLPEKESQGFVDELKDYVMIKASVPLKEGMSYTHLKCERIKVAEGTVMRMSEKYLDKCLE